MWHNPKDTAQSSDIGNLRNLTSKALGGMEGHSYWFLTSLTLVGSLHLYLTCLLLPQDFQARRTCLVLRTGLCLSALQKEGRGPAITAIFSYGSHLGLKDFFCVDYVPLHEVHNLDPVHSVRSGSWLAMILAFSISTITRPDCSDQGLPGLCSEVGTSLFWVTCWLFFLLRQIHCNKCLILCLGLHFWRSCSLWGRIWGVFLKKVSVLGTRVKLNFTLAREVPNPESTSECFPNMSPFCSFGSKSAL